LQSVTSASADELGVDLIELEPEPIKALAEFSAAMQRSGAKPALVLVKRRNAVIYMTLKANS